MTTPARMKPPAPFIADHRLIALVKQSDDATLEEQKTWLQPETFRWRRVKKKDYGNQELRPAFDLSEHWAWKPLKRDRRAKSLTDLKRRRIVITDNAGCGKSVAAEQMQYLLHQMCPGHLCLLVNFADLPQRVDEFRGTSADSSRLVEWFRNTPATVDADVQSVAKLIDHKIRSGQLTLIVDAFDQTTPDRNTSDQAAALRNFLKRHPSIRCVCTGRPHAIVDQFWRPLFSQEEWLFVQIDVFSEKQAEEFIGTERWALCQKLEATELVVPRSLEAIRRIPKTQFSDLRTASQVYWRSLLHTLEEARVTQDQNNFRFPDGTVLQKPEALLLFALLGLECNRQGYLNGVRTGQELKAFLDSLWTRHSEYLQDELGISSKRAFRQVLETLARLNVALDFAALDHSGISQVIFQNRTLQDFFAALWMCNFASDADRQWFSDQRFVRWKSDTHTHYQFWKLTAEMPDESDASNLFSRDNLNYAKAMAPLYAASTAMCPAVRSTEIIWRSWETMQSISRQRGEAASIAKAALYTFCDEYRTILAGSRGVDAQRLCEDFESWFVDVDPNAANWKAGDRDDDGEPLPVVSRRYRMSKYTVTNELYRLFDGQLDDRYAAYGAPLHVEDPSKCYGNRGRVPVVAIDWHDAWCVAKWLGAELPTESEWEYGCRAGQRTKYSVGDGTTLTKSDARFGESMESLATEVHAFANGNAWGLYQMHGNVREWCLNRCDAEKRFRSLRGGSFVSDSNECLSAYRDGRNPALAAFNRGVRLSRPAND